MYLYVQAAPEPMQEVSALVRGQWFLPALQPADLPYLGSQDTISWMLEGFGFRACLRLRV